MTYKKSNKFSKAMKKAQQGLKEGKYNNISEALKIEHQKIRDNS